MDVVEHRDHRTGPGQCLQQFPKGPGELLRGGGGFGEPHRLDEAFGDEPSLFARKEGGDLRRGRVGGVVVRDDGCLLHHLGHRPVGDALAVRQAPAAEDRGPFRNGGHELLDQPGLPHAWRTDDGEQVTGAVHRGGVEGLVEERELAVPSHHGRVDAAPDGLGTRADLVKAKGGDRLALPLERQRSDPFGIHSVAKEPVRTLADQDLARLSGLLEASRDVDGVAGDEGLTARGIAGHHLTGVDPRAGEDPEAAVALEVLVHSVQSLAHLEGGPHGPERVVFVQDGDAEHRHDGVADELLHGPPVRFEGRLHLLEVAGHDPAHGFGIEALSQAGGTGDVGEQDGHDLANLPRRRSRFERTATGRAEASALRVVLTAGGAQGHRQESRRAT